MKNIKVIDCTLRDGGYVNEWNFGEGAIKNIAKKMITTGIDMFEIGYIRNTSYNPDKTVFTSMSDAESTIHPKSNKTMYLAMIDVKEYPIEKLERRSETSIDAIRVAFAKKDIDITYDYCKRVSDLGYKLFVQPMGTDNYSDEEFINVIKTFNSLNPYAFYIVDSFGVIDRHDFKRFVYLADNNLNGNVALGYHAHNNLQQAYGNAQFFAEMNLNRDIFIDSCIFGMGRGAGNLNTEIFAEYLNKQHGKSYRIEPMLEIIDNYLYPIFMNHFWGYSLPFYLSAVNNCHPNFAKYFSDKNTLTVKSMDEILKSIPKETRGSYSKKYAEEIYLNFQKNLIDDSTSLELLKNEISGKPVLILAPGKSLKTYEDKLLAFKEEKNPFVICVNFKYDKIDSDYLFFSNQKRFEQYLPDGNEGIIITSNIKTENAKLVFNYSSLLINNKPDIIDNVTLVLLNLLLKIGIADDIYIAGFDGFSTHSEEDYSNEVGTIEKSDLKVLSNALISDELMRFMKSMEINFLTPSLYM